MMKKGGRVVIIKAHIMHPHPTGGELYFEVGYEGITRINKIEGGFEALYEDGKKIEWTGLPTSLEYKPEDEVAEPEAKGEQIPKLTVQGKGRNSFYMPVGGMFVTDGPKHKATLVRVTEFLGDMGCCVGCFFNDSDCGGVLCSPNIREDGKRVHFEEAKE
jgi:hypothetical protein